MALNKIRHMVLVFLAITVAGVSSLGAALAVAQEAESTPERGLNDAPVQMLLRGEGQNDGERVDVEIAPGQSHTSTIQIGNVGAEPLRVFAFTADITTKVNGGMQIGQVDAEQHEPTIWMEFPTEEYEIEPGTEVAKEYTITVPEGTAPGQYVIPVAVETVDSFAVGGSSMLRQKVRKVMTIYVTVPGDIPTGFEFGESRIEYGENGLPVAIVPISNTGRSTLRLSGTMSLKDGAGQVLVEAPVVLGTIYGGHETNIMFMVPPTIPVGDYQLSLQLTDNVTGTVNQFENATVTMPEAPVAAEQVPLDFQDVMILPNAEPIQFASIVIEIANNIEVHRSTKLTLVVAKDGEPLEEFVLAENMTLEQGVTTVSQRYLPITGWESGTYTFSLRLESADASSGSLSVLLTEDDVATLDVP